jgi:hypothetical protein
MLAYIYEFELLKGDRVVDRWVERNLIPSTGVNYLAQAMFGDTSPIGTYYIGLFQNNYVPVNGATSADIPGTIQEFTGYSQATRPLWSRVYDGAGAWDNVAARAEFSVTADQRIYGGFLVSSSAKNSSTGLLLSVARFASPKDITAGLTLRVRAGITLVPTTLV